MQNSDIHQLRLALKRHDLSVTKARLHVFEILLKSNYPITIQEIIHATTKLHFVSVYRTVDALLKAGVIRQVPIGFKNKYEVSDQFKPHHHHVTCEKCGNSSAIHNESIEQLMRKITLSAGMKPTKHHFEVYGVCKNCIN